MLIVLLNPNFKGCSMIWGRRLRKRSAERDPAGEMIWLQKYVAYQCRYQLYIDEKHEKDKATSIGRCEGRRDRQDNDLPSGAKIQVICADCWDATEPRVMAG